MVKISFNNDQRFADVDPLSVEQKDADDADVWLQVAVWQCITLHMQYFAMALASKFTLNDVRAFDCTIYQKQQLFLRIPEYYDFWMPKNHFAQHFPLDVLIWGPLIQYYTLMFEMENGEYKQAARSSNRHNPLLAAASGVAMRRALDTYRGTPGRKQLPQPEVRMEETVPRGRSPMVDALWHSGAIPTTTQQVMVTWLHGLRVGTRIIARQTFLLASSSGRSPELTRVREIFQVGPRFWLALTIYKTSPLKKDPDNNVLFAFHADVPKAEAEAQQQYAVCALDRLSVTVLHDHYTYRSGVPIYIFVAR